MWTHIPKAYPEKPQNTSWNSVVHSLSWLWPETENSFQKGNLGIGHISSLVKPFIVTVSQFQAQCWIKGSSFSMNLGFSEATPRVTFRKMPPAGASPLAWNIIDIKKKQQRRNIQSTGVISQCPNKTTWSLGASDMEMAQRGQHRQDREKDARRGCEDSNKLPFKQWNQWT